MKFSDLVGNPFDRFRIKTRRLSANWCFEPTRELESVYGINAEEEIAKILQEEILKELKDSK